MIKQNREKLENKEVTAEVLMQVTGAKERLKEPEMLVRDRINFFFQMIEDSTLNRFTQDLASIGNESEAEVANGFNEFRG
jgi:hypothetical protein